MLERAFQNPGEDFHVAVRMRGETTAGRHDVLIDHPQRTKLRVVRVVVLVERECEARIEPRNLVVAALFRWTNFDHGVLQLPPDISRGGLWARPCCEFRILAIRCATNTLDSPGRKLQSSARLRLLRRPKKKL